MKHLSIILLALIFMAALSSCQNDMNEGISDAEITELESATFFKENISIFDARVRSLNSTSYVKELYLANFSDEDWDKTSVGFEGELFEDNGLGNDLIANDEIYTSVLNFAHNSSIKFEGSFSAVSVLETPIISPYFTKLNELQSYSYEYTLNRPNGSANRISGPVATLECDVEICSTGCIADWIWDGFGCICVSNCSAKIGWE